MLRGLVVKDPWVEKILKGRKTWEIRGSKTNIRGTIALIRKGSGLIVGSCELIDVRGPLTKKEIEENIDKHCVPLTDLKKLVRYEKTYAWVLKDARTLKQPIRYKHPSGAVIWVKLPETLIL